MRVPFPVRTAAAAVLFCVAVLGTRTVPAATEAPVNVQIALLSKVLDLNRALAGDVIIHVVGADEFAAALGAFKGKRFGSRTLADVTTGGPVPAGTAQVVYLGDAGQVDAVMAHSRANGIMTVTGLPALVAKGISLGIGIEGGKPAILINAAASRAERIDWNPAILKISTVVE